MIGSEIMRAKVWQNQNQPLFRDALERSLPLVDFSLEDSKWEEDRYSLFVLRDELVKFYTNLRTDNIETLYQAL